MPSMHQDDGSPLPACLEDARDVLTLLPVSVGEHLRGLANVWGVKPSDGESEGELRSKVRSMIRQAQQAEMGDGDAWTERHRP